MVHTRLAAIKSKKYILPTKNNRNNSMDLNNDSYASNIVNDNDNIELIVPETQTQIVNPTQFSGGTASLDDREQLLEDCDASGLEKTPVLSTTGEKA